MNRLNSLTDYIPQITKAIAATVASFIFVRLKEHGITLDETQLEEIIGAILVGVATWALPNRKRVRPELQSNVSDTVYPYNRSGTRRSALEE